VRPEIVAALVSDPAFRRLAFSHTGGREFAEDALQDAALIALTKGPDVPLKEARRWFNTVLRRECWKLGRRARERRERPMSTVAGRPEHGGIDSFPGRRSAAERAELQEELAPLAALPARQRQTLLESAAGFTYEEICARRGYSARQVERYLLNGRRRARRLAREAR
jgi:RNA polymerase sigma factor (sigma-70 family)